MAKNCGCFLVLLVMCAMGPLRAQEVEVVAAHEDQTRAPAAVGPSSPTDVTSGAWLEALQSSFPLTPEQIQKLREEDSAASQAAMSRPTPAAARSDVLAVDLSPGAESPIIELLHGFATSIEVLDASGKPWPVANFTVGDDSAFKVELVGAALASDVAQSDVDTPAAIGSVLTLTAKRRFAATNLIVVLQNQSRPISVVLRAAEPTATAQLRDRVTLSVQALGPYAQSFAAKTFEHLDAGEDVRAALMGQAPRADARELLGAELPPGTRAWRSGQTLWLRTEHTLISPAHEASVSGGVHRAYRLRYLPVVVLSDLGSLKEVHLQEVAP